MPEGAENQLYGRSQPYVFCYAQDKILCNITDQSVTLRKRKGNMSNWKVVQHKVLKKFQPRIWYVSSHDIVVPEKFWWLE